MAALASEWIRPAPRWQVNPTHPEAEAALRAALPVSPLIARLMVARGWGDPAVAERVLNPRLEDLHPPHLLPDYQAAVRAILNARDQGETIYVHGDYDVDGVTSAALLTRFLRRIGATVIPHVPHRMTEGYGVHVKAVQWAKESGAKLFLTCDCGVTAHEQVKAAKAAGMKVVVTDHHELAPTLPEAEAVVNPHRADSQYPFAEISGVGVAFKLILGMAEELGVSRSNTARAFLDLAVLGTVADVMPLIDENRIIARYGLPALRESKKPGIRALLRVSQLSEKPVLTTRHIGFQLGPRLNAVGRIDDAEKAMRLLLTDDPQEAEELAAFLNDRNEARREAQKAMQEEAVERVLAEGLHERYVIAVAGQNWHHGIVGIVAGRLVEQFRRPAFVLGQHGEGLLKGSARSIPGFHLKDAIDELRPLLASGGGHAMAAGVSLEQSNFAAFSDGLDALARQVLTPEDFIPVIPIDAEVTMAEADLRAAEELSLLEPYGQANPQPILAVRGVTLDSTGLTKTGEHARLTWRQDRQTRTTFVWNQPELAQTPTGGQYDVAFQMEINEYQGRREVKWQMVDFRPSA